MRPEADVQTLTAVKTSNTEVRAAADGSITAKVNTGERGEEARRGRRKGRDGFRDNSGAGG